MKKRIIALLTLLALTVSLLAGCGKEPAPANQPEPDTSTVPVVEENGPYLYYFGQYYRLYAQGLNGGTPVRVLDRSVFNVHRAGDDLLAVCTDGDILRIGSDGTVETLTTDRDANWVFPYDGGFIFSGFSMVDGYRYCSYDYATGQVAELDLPEAVYEFAIRGDRAIYYNNEYNEGTDNYTQKLVCIQLGTWEELWRVDLGEDVFVDYFADDGDDLWAALESGEFTDDGYVLHYRFVKIDPADGTLTDVEVPFDADKYRLTAVGSGGYLVEGNWQTDFTPYFFTRDGQKRTLSMNMGTWGMVVQDKLGDTVLLRASVEAQDTILDEDVYAYQYYYYLLNLADGSVQELTDTEHDGKMFLDADFPVMDSSTARKPVTLALYQYFCMSNGVGGAHPLCSTTHNAWLNIADRVADIALLAAPTAEEEAYLKEKGVEVEMKLYGGDGLVFIANRACGVENITLDDLRAVYRGEITNWSQLGGVDQPIHVLYRDDQSGSQRLFEKLLFKGMDVPDMEALGFEREDEMSTIVDQCIYDPYALGYSIMTYLNNVYDEPELRVFSLEGVPASPDSVLEGTYPLSTQGYVVIRADEPENSPARRLYDWIGCPVSDDILTGCGVTPLHGEE